MGLRPAVDDHAFNLCYSYSMDFVVLSSSQGTTFQAVLDAIASKQLTANFKGIVADRFERGCVAKAKKAGFPVRVVKKKIGEHRELYDQRLHEAILSLLPSKDPTTIVVCIGWMFILSSWFVRHWKNHILNVHPSLLPKHPGAHAHDLVLASKDTESGMTIHIIDEGLDTGKILVQKKCAVLPGDTVDTLKARVQKLECEWYPKTLQMMERGELKM